MTGRSTRRSKPNLIASNAATLIASIKASRQLGNTKRWHYSNLYADGRLVGMSCGNEAMHFAKALALPLMRQFGNAMLQMCGNVAIPIAAVALLWQVLATGQSELP